MQKLLVFLTTQRGQPKYFKNVGEKFGKNFPSEYHEAILLVHQLHALNFCSPNCGNFDILFPALEILAETKKLQNTKRNQIGITLVYYVFIRIFFKKQFSTFLRYFTFLSLHMSAFLYSRYHSKQNASMIKMKSDSIKISKHFLSVKGQLISKANCQAVNSS